MASSILQSIFCGMRMSGNTSPPPSPPKLSPPCLILPSPYEVGYKKLYSLTEKKVLSIEKAAPPPAWAQGRRVKHMGCSYGWVTSFNKDTNQTFLFDPITGCHMKLPEVDHATRPRYIILSSSPGSPACRAIMQFEPPWRIAVCSPAHGRGACWLPVCGAGPYSALCYSTRHDHLFCLTSKTQSVSVLECWHLEYHASFLWRTQLGLFSEVDLELTDAWRTYLLIDEHSDRLFVVLRAIRAEVPDGYGDDFDDDDVDVDDDDVDEEEEEELWRRCLHGFSNKTLLFHVYELIDRKQGGGMRYMDGSLDGLAMFVGSNHAFALPAADFNLTPDSIYFNENGASYIDEDGRNDDIGIYNYVDGKISSIDYPSPISTITSRIAPAMWLTPTPH